MVKLVTAQRIVMVPGTGMREISGSKIRRTKREIKRSMLEDQIQIIMLQEKIWAFYTTIWGM